MSYLVLARKWRPQSFDDLVGQEHVSQTLGNAIRSGRVHHAFIFTGARGVGKTSAARILAKALNCETGPTPSPCNVCPACLEITAGNSIDVFEIDGASSTGVDDIRELRENIRYLPSRCRYKIFIIDEVHMLSINAFNALLKTLEEPPPHAKFIFATTEPHKIPITILSRCQRFDFRKIALPRMLARLREIVDAEGVETSDRALALVARRGEGSMRDALSTMDQVIAFCGTTIADDDVQGLLGMVDRRLLLDTAEAVLQHDSRRLLESVRRVDNLGHSFRQFSQELVDVFRSLVLCKVLDDAAAHLEATAEELRDLQTMTAAVSLEDLQRALTLLLRAEVDLATSSFPRLTLEMALVRLAHLPPTRDVATLVRKIEDLERRLGGEVALPAPPARPLPHSEEAPPPAKKEPAPPPPPAAEQQRDWPGLVAYVRGRRPGIGSMLEHGSLLNMALPLLEIGFPAGSFHLDQVRDEGSLAVIGGLAQEFFGAPVTLRVTAVAASQAAVPPSLAVARQTEDADRRRQMEGDARAHPAVQAVLEVFGGEIHEVRAIDKMVKVASEE